MTRPPVHRTIVQGLLCATCRALGAHLVKRLCIAQHLLHDLPRRIALGGGDDKLLNLFKLMNPEDKKVGDSVVGRRFNDPSAGVWFHVSTGGEGQQHAMSSRRRAGSTTTPQLVRSALGQHQPQAPYHHLMECASPSPYHRFRRPTHPPENPERVSPMAADLFPEACRVPHVFKGQVGLLKPALSVQRAQRLLAGRNQVLVVTLAWWGTMYVGWEGSEGQHEEKANVVCEGSRNAKLRAQPGARAFEQ